MEVSVEIRPAVTCVCVHVGLVEFNGLYFSLLRTKLSKLWVELDSRSSSQCCILRIASVACVLDFWLLIPCRLFFAARAVRRPSTIGLPTHRKPFFARSISGRQRETGVGLGWAELGPLLEAKWSQKNSPLNAPRYLVLDHFTAGDSVGPSVGRTGGVGRQGLNNSFAVVVVVVVVSRQANQTVRRLSGLEPAERERA